MDLRRAGLDARSVDEALATETNAEEILEAAARAGRKYWRRAAGEPDERKRRWKFVQYLVRRGFSSDVAHSVWQVVKREAELGP